MISTLLGFGKSIFDFLSNVNYTSGQPGLGNRQRSPENEKAAGILFKIYTNGQAERKSVTRMVEDSIAYYPLVVSDSVQPDNIFKVAKLVETRIAAYIKVILSTQVGSIDSAEVAKVAKSISGDFRIGDNTAFDTAFRAYSVEESLMTCADLKKSDFISECLYDPSVVLTEAKDGSADAKKRDRTNVNIEQRANLIMPTIVTVDTHMNSGTNTVDKKLTLGVKAVPHVSKSNDLIDALNNLFSNSSVILKFIRWTTGEISFFRDIVANYDDIKKAELAGGKSNGHRMINHLKKHATGSALNMAMREQATFLPTTTLLLNKTDVEQIRTNTGVDILRDHNAKIMCADLALMTVMVIDENLDALHVYDDNSQGSYELYSLKDLNKSDNGKIETIFKALIDPRR